jgi:polynucleotide 5'-hydroxyl-kinase GRC3/NOL9
MPQNWTNTVVNQLLSHGLTRKGIYLILGATDTGKTTLALALVRYAASRGPVGFIDADIGQSHIGPPATVGWAVVNDPQIDFNRLMVNGIGFVGDITPVGHLLQLTAAITQCFQQISKLVDLVIIDTPGFINGQAADVLWWTVQHILQPELILAVQRNDELKEIIAGLQFIGNRIEQIHCPSQIPTKSPQERQRYRQSQFNKYFKDHYLYNINLRHVAIQRSRNLYSDNLVNRLVGLRDDKGIDIAVSQLKDWQPEKDIAVVKAPKIEIPRIRYLIIGDATIEIIDE